jgi:hypothetical protein
MKLTDPQLGLGMAQTALDFQYLLQFSLPLPKQGLEV